MKQFNCLSVRSAPGTRGRLSRPAYARGLNHVPHTMLSFGGRVTSPRTAAFAAFFNASRRLTRSLCTVPLTGMLGLALLLAGCAGSDDPTPPAADNSRAVSKIQTLVGEDYILVGWTNPSQSDFTGFDVTWSNVADRNETGTVSTINLDPAQANLLTPADDLLVSEKRVIYNITDLGPTEGNIYQITIAVLYAEGAPERSVVRSDAEDPDPDIDLDGVNNDEDAFPTDDCASVDGDGDGRPDRRLRSDCIPSEPLDSDGGFPAVLNVVATSAGNNITVSWTNPNRAGTGFTIAWVNVNENAEATDTGTKALSTTEANVAAGASDNTYKITGLTYAATYNITVAVHYVGKAEPVASAPVQSRTGTDPATTPPDGGNGGTSNPRAVADIQTAVNGNNMTVRWTNPDQEGQDEITGFNVTWFNVGNTSDSNAEELNSTLADTSPGARVSYNITGLLYNTTYAITIAVLYADGTSVVSSPVQNTTGMDPNGGGGDGIGGDPNGGGDARFPAVSDVQVMVSGNTITVSWTNPSQDGQGEIIGFNINWVNVDDDADSGTEELDSDEVNVAAGASDNTDTITGLIYDATYEITVAVRYAGRPDPVLSAAVEHTIGADPNADDDDDDVVNGMDNCPLVGNPEQFNNDTDTLGDACDSDDNNNGLIEIHNLDQLALLRDDLDGNGMDDNEIDAITVESVGCPVPDGCVGYELTRSLNFSDAASYADGTVNTAWTTGSGWVPIGSCVAPNDCTPYAGIFDGRDHTLADLFISAEDTANGVGLFGAFNGSVQNLHLRNATVRGGAAAVGGLVGNGQNGRYENLSVTDVSVMSPSAISVGGLVGDGSRTTIRYAGVSGLNVVGSTAVGGLTGAGGGATIRYVYASSGSVNTIDSDGGGLIGSGATNIRYAYVLGVDVSGTGVSVGGLIGLGQFASARYTYVSGGSVTGDIRAGGLIGNGELSQTYYSYAATGQILITSSSPQVGGLIGQIFDSPPAVVTASYWDTQTTQQSNSAANLGTGQTTAQLKSPLTFAGIYEDWGGIWCHPDTGAVMEVDAQPDGFLSVWDLGTSSQYPALNCMPDGLSAQGR